MNKSVKNHRKEISQKMKTLRYKNPKEYWKILNTKQKISEGKISIDSLYDFFKNLNEFDQEEGQSLPDIPQVNLDSLNEIMNSIITEEEINKAMKKLNNNKACGDDEIYNEYIKNSQSKMIDIYVKLFNIILDTGTIPESWLSGNIIPIYKNKGSKDDPKNYRPITIISCLGKLFTSILNDRLSKFSDEVNLICENQAGFRKGYSTIDNIFILHSLIDMFKQLKKKLYCIFIDFEKAFDKVWREGLWHKLLANNIGGKVYNIIYNIYQGIKSRISFEGNFSEFFPCNNGLRQGENLSPFLFSLYLNDIENFFIQNNVRELTTITEDIAEQLGIYIKLFILLYADDTVLLAESAENLQSILNVFQDYCKLWKLKINVDKSKVVIFSNGRVPNKDFILNGEKLEKVTEFN